MGQDIKYIATNKHVDLPDRIVHFFEKNALVIPVDLGDGEYEMLLRNAEKLGKLQQLFDHIRSDCYYEESVHDIFETLEYLAVDSFILTGYREIMDMPQEEGRLLVQDGKIMKLDAQILFNEAFKMLGLQIENYGIVSNEDRYYSFDDAFFDYHKDNPKEPLLKRRFE